jgi:hypothetical protein
MRSVFWSLSYLSHRRQSRGVCFLGSREYISLLFRLSSHVQKAKAIFFGLAGLAYESWLARLRLKS